MRLQAECYRAHDPRWSFLPLSGAGATKRGGRFNPVGVEALYLALTIEGAIREAMQGPKQRLEPLTICLYDVDCENVLDLRTRPDAEATGVRFEDLGCAWLDEKDRGRTPTSWALAMRLRDRGTAGILVPSFAPAAPADAFNLVLWRWGPDLPHRVTVHDPSGKLPSDQLSWPQR